MSDSPLVAQSSTLNLNSISYTVTTKTGPRKLVDDVSLSVSAGEMLAIMGPSGAGKSTLLDAISGRKPIDFGGSIVLNGQTLERSNIRNFSSYVEQEDALLGVLTARETITYALRLAEPRAPTAFCTERVNSVITMLGLNGCADMIIGTPIKRGLSGGQKRRVSIACSLVTFPRVLFLDEPTSGLDSTATLEVLSSLSVVAKKEGIIVIATIHQPSISAIQEFSRLLILSAGAMCYEGEVEALEGWLSGFGVEVPKHVTPTDATISIINTDFTSGSAETDVAAKARALAFCEYFKAHHHAQEHAAVKKEESETGAAHGSELVRDRENMVGGMGGVVLRSWILSQRVFLNYRRNLLAYGIRGGMYAGMGFMLATIWVHLGYNASTINDRLSVHFYSVAFLAFMSVAGIPGYLEERATFKKEYANGLYGVLPFVISNTLVNIPFLFACSTVFVLIMYWGIGLHPGAAAVFRYIAFLFLAIYVAESQVVLVASVVPIFVAALAIGAFLNGFWMSVGGYFIKAISLPRFWYYSFHWMDYQTFAFALLTNSDLRGLTFTCADGQCPYPSSIGDGTQFVSGQDVLDYLQIGGISFGAYAGIMIGIAVVYRVMFFAILKFFK